MKILESGGRAAALAMERLRGAQRRLEPFEMSPELLLLCREEELLAPLLEWLGADTPLRSVLKELESGSEGASTDLFVSRGSTLLSGSPIAERQKVDSAATPGFVQGSPGPPGMPDAAVRDVAADQVQRILEASLTRDDSTAAAWLESKPEGKAAAPPPPVRAGPVRPVLARRPAEATGEHQGILNAVTATEASRRLEARLGADERTARAWDQPVSSGTDIPRVAAILEDPGRGVSSVTDAPPADPVSRRLQAAVDRALHVRAAGRDGQPSRPSPGFQTAAPGKAASPLERDTPASAGPVRHSLGEPPRQSGLRRLASLGETMEPERVLPMPAPSPAEPREAPPRPPRVPWERDDLAREIADIFRLEALRHGIAPEEDVP